MSGCRQSPQLLYAMVAALLHLATSADAQTSAVLQGTVIDPSGAVVSGTTVLAEHTATGTQRHSLTDASGRYQFVALMAGEYRIEVRAQAFGSQILERFVVDGGRTIVQDFRLALDAVAENVVISARTSPIDRATVSVGHVIDERLVHDTPLNGRRFVDLGILLPGSVTLRKVDSSRPRVAETDFMASIPPETVRTPSTSWSTGSP
jgi:hypothetical protein